MRRNSSLPANIEKYRFYLLYKFDPGEELFFIQSITPDNISKYGYMLGMNTESDPQWCVDRIYQFDNIGELSVINVEFNNPYSPEKNDFKRNIIFNVIHTLYSIIGSDKFVNYFRDHSDNSIRSLCGISKPHAKFVRNLNVLYDTNNPIKVPNIFDLEGKDARMIGGAKLQDSMIRKNNIVLNNPLSITPFYIELPINMYFTSKIVKEEIHQESMYEYMKRQYWEEKRKKERLQPRVTIY